MIESDLHEQTGATPVPPQTPKRPTLPRRRLYNSVDARERRKKRVRYLLGAGVVILVVNALIGDTGYLATLRAQREHDVVRAQIEKLRLENERLSDLSRRLKDDPAAVEDAARRDLGLVRPGETLVIVRDGKPAGK